MNIADTRKQHKAAKRIQRALKKDPNDIEALFALAATLDSRKKPEADQKRKVLHQILSLEPYNREARDTLFEMDRAEIGGKRSRLSLATILTDPLSLPEPPLTLRYSIVHRFLVYLFIICAVLLGLSSVRDIESLALVGALLLFLLIPTWFVSAVIEISDAGIHVSRLFGLARLQIPWRDIREARPTFMGRGIKIINCAGKAVEVSAQVQGYPFILDILHQMRPDLFHIPQGSQAEDGAQNPAAITPLVAKTADKI